MINSTHLLSSRYSEIIEKLSSIQNDRLYPFIVLPDSFSFISDKSINSDSLFKYCVHTGEDNPCMNTTKQPREPIKPHLNKIPTSHNEYIREGFWQSHNGFIFKYWLILTFLFGGLPGFFLIDGLRFYERLLHSLAFVLLWTPLLIYLLCEKGEKRGMINRAIPYSEEEINILTEKEKERYEKEQTDYQNAILQYEQDLKHYNNMLIEREKIKCLRVNSYLSWKFKESFIKSDNYSVVDETPKKGRSEDVLFASLMHSIPSSVHIDTMISGYYSDIMIATNNDVFIDIEIDEPYDMDSKKEIHYIGGSDEKRNEHIANHNWIILRFSEKQIMTECASCSKIIENLKKLVEEGDFEALDGIISIKDSIKDSRWKKEDARLMAINNYRKSY